MILSMTVTHGLRPPFTSPHQDRLRVVITEITLVVVMITAAMTLGTIIVALITVKSIDTKITDATVHTEGIANNNDKEGKTTTIGIGKWNVMIAEESNNNGITLLVALVLALLLLDVGKSKRKKKKGKRRGGKDTQELVDSPLLLRVTVLCIWMDILYSLLDAYTRTSLC